MPDETHNYLDSAKWGIERTSDGLYHIGVPDKVPRPYDSPIIKLVWIGPLPKLQAEWLMDAITRKQIQLN